MNHARELKIAIFADGADLKRMATFAARPDIAGLTTNPSLMAKAGIADYREFGRLAIAAAAGKSISLEVFADDFRGMEAQARELASWAPNVHVKVPVTNTQGWSTAALIGRLTAEGIRVNVTAIMTVPQVHEVVDAIHCEGCIVSVFAGRIADTGTDPETLMRDAAGICRRSQFRPQLLWASVREPFNVIQAERCGCDIVTVTPEILEKLSLFGRELSEYSLQTVIQFHNDAKGLAL